MWPHLEPGVEAGGVEVGVPGAVAAPPRPHVVGDELGDGGVPGEAQELITPSLSSPISRPHNNSPPAWWRRPARAWSPPPRT